MERVTGIGGIFFKAQKPDELRRWYAAQLGVALDADQVSVIRWREDAQPERRGSTTWAIFDGDTHYFGASAQPYMINYRVADLEAMLAQLRAAGAAVDERVEQTPFGRFGWVTDPEGNRLELWQPPDGE